MKKTIAIIVAFFALLVMSSFTGKPEADFIGSYGVAAADPAQIILKINADHTFYYQDLSVSGHKIITQGTWRLKGKRVVLQSEDAKINFHHVWSFVAGGNVAKSRKGLTFYRLCKIGG